MSITVLVPTPLQKFTNDQATINCTGGTIAELIESLESNCPGIKARLCDEEGKPRRFLNLYVNSEDIRFLDGTKTPLQDGDEVSIVPAVAGGWGDIGLQILGYVGNAHPTYEFCPTNGV